MYGFRKYKGLYNVLLFPKKGRIRTLQTGSDYVQVKLAKDLDRLYVAVTTADTGTFDISFPFV